MDYQMFLEACEMFIAQKTAARIKAPRVSRWASDSSNSSPDTSLAESYVDGLKQLALS